MRERSPEQLKGQIRSFADTALRALWKNYCENNSYASEISFEEVIETTRRIAEMLEF